MTKQYKILSIDAWAEFEDSWSWNNWYTIGHTDQLPDSVESFVKVAGLEPTKDFNPNDYALDDDQYNIVLIRKADYCPLYAIEYGSNY